MAGLGGGKSRDRKRGQVSTALDRDPGGRGELGRGAGRQGEGTGVEVACGQLWPARGDGWGRWPECGKMDGIKGVNYMS